VILALGRDAAINTKSAAVNRVTTAALAEGVAMTTSVFNSPSRSRSTPPG
jgi:hypothetical protein